MTEIRNPPLKKPTISILMHKPSTHRTTRSYHLKYFSLSTGSNYEIYFFYHRPTKLTIKVLIR
jgi:hypothetical protein